MKQNGAIESIAGERQIPVNIHKTNFYAECNYEDLSGEHNIVFVFSTSINCGFYQKATLRRIDEIDAR